MFVKYPYRNQAPFFVPLLHLLILFLIPLAMSGCGAFIVAGAGAGAYSYISGNVIRTYSADYKETVRACRVVLNQLQVEILEESGDALKTKVRSSRYDGAEITIGVERVGNNLTQVGIRTGFIGIDKTDDSELLHQYIDDQLRKGTAGVKRKKQAATITTIKPTDSKLRAKPEESSAVDVSERVTEEKAGYDTAAGDEGNDLLRSSAATYEPPRSPLYIFYRDQDTSLPPGYRAQVDSFVTYLQRNPSSTIDIRSYTDSTGEPEDNLDLSKKRAEAVKQYFIEQGIAPAKIIARGFGASNFLESNETESLRKMNRRVELRILQ